MSVLVAIRFDVSASVGTGHLRRAIAIGKELNNRNIPHSFVVKNHSLQTARNLGVSTDKLVGFNPDNGEKDWIQRLPNLTHVITDYCHREYDHSSTYSSVANIFKRKRVFVAVIDSMPPYHFQSKFHEAPSIVVTPYLDADKFRTAPACQSWLVGIDFVILDKEYSILHDKFDSSLSAGNYILICCGGSDPHHFSTYILSELFEECQPQVHTKVVVGNLFDNTQVKSLHSIAKQYPQVISLESDRNNISDLVANCGILVGTVGLIRYEAACLGRPSFLILRNPDHENYLRNFHKSKIGNIYFMQIESERKQFQSIVRQLCTSDSFSEKSKPNLRAFQSVDGRGVKRILDTLLSFNN